MNRDERIWVGLGEVLWDVLPDAQHLGGAPANFAYHASVLGAHSAVASRVGTDERGRHAVERLRQLGVETLYIQTDEARPTGTVRVQVDGQGQPRYAIAEDVAWDFLTWTEEWQELAQKADVICWGSLAQRSPVSRGAIHQFLRTAPTRALRIFDVNLRGGFFSPEVLTESLRLARIVKLNDEELPRVLGMLGGDGGQILERGAQWLIQNYDLELVCVTRGSRGSLLVTETETFEHPGLPATVVDTVGAGDAFTAALAFHHLRGASLERMSEAANRLGAWVAAHAGATPPADQSILRRVIGDAENV